MITGALFRSWSAWIAVLVTPIIPLGTQAQDEASLVKITGTDRPGSGIVIMVDETGATVLTAMHVIAGARPFQVSFAAAPAQRFTVEPTDVTGMQQDESDGLAVFRVRGNVPPAVRAASLDTRMNFSPPEPLTYWGYPDRSLSPRVISGTFSARDGIRLVMSPSVGEGTSGGPVFRRSMVVGVVTASDQRFAYAVQADVAAIALRGWGIALRPVPIPLPTDPAGVQAGGGRESLDYVRVIMPRIEKPELLSGPRAPKFVVRYDNGSAERASLITALLSTNEIPFEERLVPSIPPSVANQIYYPEDYADFALWIQSVMANDLPLTLTPVGVSQNSSDAGEIRIVIGAR